MVRIIIVLLLCGSAYLGWNAWKQQQRLDYLNTALAKGGSVPQMVQEIQQWSTEYTEFMRLGSDVGFEGNDPTNYIYGVAAKDAVKIGLVNVRPSARARENEREGFVDRDYVIDPGESKANFDRMSIANFLFSLEDGDKRLKVTKVQLDAIGKEGGRTPKPNEVPQDRWEMGVTVTVRDKLQAN